MNKLLAALVLSTSAATAAMAAEIAIRQVVEHIPRNGIM